MEEKKETLEKTEEAEVSEQKMNEVSGGIQAWPLYSQDAPGELDGPLKKKKQKKKPTVITYL